MRPSQCPECGCYSICLNPGSVNCAEPTESHDSEPHVHKVIESMPWWAQLFTQWAGRFGGHG